MHGVHEVQMLSSGPYNIVSILMQKCIATIVVPTHKNKPSFHKRGDLCFQTQTVLEHKVMSPDKTRNQEWLLVRASNNKVDWTGQDNLLSLNPAHCCLNMRRGVAMISTNKGEERGICKKEEKEVKGCRRIRVKELLLRWKKEKQGDASGMPVRWTNKGAGKTVGRKWGKEMMIQKE